MTRPERTPVASTFLLRFQESAEPNDYIRSALAGTATRTKTHGEAPDNDPGSVTAGTLTMTRQECESPDHDATATHRVLPLVAGTETYTEIRGEGRDSDPATLAHGTQTLTATVEEMDQDSPSMQFSALPTPRQ